VTVIFLLIPISIIIAVGFLLAFIWAVRSGQYEDTETPSLRLLLEEKRQSQADPKAGIPKAKAAANQSGARNEQETARPE